MAASVFPVSVCTRSFEGTMLWKERDDRVESIRDSSTSHGGSGFLDYLVDPS